MFYPIIIVDDNLIALEMTRAFLHNEGFSPILTFSNPTTALNEIRAGLCPHILLTDYDMPEMTGLELLDMVQSTHPDVKGIISTASSEFNHNAMERYSVVLKGDKQYFKNLKQIITENYCTNTCADALPV